MYHGLDEGRRSEGAFPDLALPVNDGLNDPVVSKTHLPGDIADPASDGLSPQVVGQLDIDVDVARLFQLPARGGPEELHDHAGAQPVHSFGEIPGNFESGLICGFYSAHINTSAIRGREPLGIALFYHITLP